MFPDCKGEQAAQIADSWLSGQDCEPTRRSMKPDESSRNYIWIIILKILKLGPHKISAKTDGNPEAQALHAELNKILGENHQLKSDLHQLETTIQNLQQENEQLIQKINNFSA